VLRREKANRAVGNQCKKGLLRRPSSGNLPVRGERGGSSLVFIQEKKVEVTKKVDLARDRRGEIEGCGPDRLIDDQIEKKTKIGGKEGRERGSSLNQPDGTMLLGIGSD